VLMLFQLPVNKELGQNYDGSMIANEKISWLEFMRI
jgi:hypothetical protein